jgi:putative lipoic acid-binding regulatory protein
MDELTNDLNKSEQLSFPVTFELKVIMDATIPDKVNTTNIEGLLNKMNIPKKGLRNRLSEKGRYMSYTYEVTIIDHATLKELYKELKTLPGIKMAI